MCHFTKIWYEKHPQVTTAPSITKNNRSVLLIPWYIMLVCSASISFIQTFSNLSSWATVAAVLALSLIAFCLRDRSTVYCTHRPKLSCKPIRLTSTSTKNSKQHNRQYYSGTLNISFVILLHLISSIHRVILQWSWPPCVATKKQNTIYLITVDNIAIYCSTFYCHQQENHMT